MAAVEFLNLPTEVFDRNGTRHRLIVRLPSVPKTYLFHVEVSCDNGVETALLQFGEREKGIMRLECMHVYDGHRRKGLGKALLDLVEDYAKRTVCTKITAHVRAFAYEPKTAGWLLEWYINRGYNITHKGNDPSDQEYLGSIEKKI